MALTKTQLRKIHKVCAQLAAERTAKQAAATDVLAIKVTLEQPQHDGTFEILFMTREEADAYKTRGGSGSIGSSEEISFSEGIALAKRDDCSGGPYSLTEAQRFQRINPVVRAMKLAI